MPLDTLTNVKAQLTVEGGADDALLATLNDCAGDYIAAYCRRNFDGGSATEYLPGGGARLFLSAAPVSAVTAVKVDANRTWGAETLRPAGSYVVHLERGVIESLAGAFGPALPGVVRVEYSAPSGVPGPVARANAELVGHWYRQAKTQAALGHVNMLSRIVPEADGGGEARYAASGMSLPPVVLELLRPYRNPAL